MIRSLLLGLTAGMTTLLALASPHQATAQYGPYPAAPQSRPYQPREGPTQPPVPVEELGGTWYFSGHEEQPCELIPSRRGDRALFINEKGNRAEGFFRGNRIIVPKWGNLQGRLRDDTILWSNGTYWTR